MERRYTITADRRQELEQLIRSLPAMLAGRVPDAYGIAAGFKSRLAFMFFSLVAHDFERKGRGLVGTDGISWAPLSREYLAYVRPVTGRKPPKAGGLAPGGKDGHLTPEQMRLWNRTFADRYAWFVMRESDADAKAHAAAIAWIVVKEAGAKTKLDTFGSRVAGVEYQILVDVGNLRRSLMPGTLTAESQANTGYIPQRDQRFDDLGNAIVVGSADPKAKYHHHGKGRRSRRFWPEKLPDDWWRQIYDAAAGGFAQIGTLLGGTAA